MNFVDELINKIDMTIINASKFNPEMKKEIIKLCVAETAKYIGTTNWHDTLEEVNAEIDTKVRDLISQTEVNHAE